MKYLLLRSEGEHHSVLVVVPVYPELIARLEKRSALADLVTEADDRMSSVGFFFYDMDLYECDDMEEFFEDDEQVKLVLDFENDIAGELQRKDYGEIKFTGRGRIYIRFGIKHTNEINETTSFTLKGLKDAFEKAIDAA